MQIGATLRKLLTAEKRSTESRSNTNSTVIADQATFTGDLLSDSDIWIYGRVDGNIGSSSSVHIQSSGKVFGDIETSTAYIAGEVNGQISCQDSLHILGSATVTGDIRSENILVDKGALISGRIDITGDDQASEDDSRAVDTSEEE